MEGIKLKYNILALDPSGNFENGQGSTGVAYTNPFGEIELSTISAKDFTSKDAYYRAIWNELVNHFVWRWEWCPKIYIVIEDFKLQLGKAGAQANQRLETSELIAYLETKFNDYKEYNETEDEVFRQLNTVKSRWKNDYIKRNWEEDFPGVKLVKNGSTRHSMDALRHLMQAYFFTIPKLEKKQKKK